MHRFIVSFGSRALRRPLEVDEVADLEALARANGGDFIAGVETVIRSVLQDPEFLYLVECGGCTQGATPSIAPDNRSFKLSPWEKASRLSYLLWGRMPDKELLDLAGRPGALDSPDTVREQALRMLASSAAHERVSRFHAMWLGYEGAPLKLPRQMAQETSKLLERVIFDRRAPAPAPWLDIFRSPETFVDSALAAHYGNVGKPVKAGGDWVKYGASGRQGIFSHATFLTLGKAGDASPTIRGRDIQARLLCNELKLPSAEELKRLNNGVAVDADKPPPLQPGECQMAARVRTYLKPGTGCFGCHDQLDSVGFGLDNYDRDGKFRSFGSARVSDPTSDDVAPNPKCTISGEGRLASKSFKGPAGLADALLETEDTKAKLVNCVTRQFFRFSAGRKEPYAEDEQFIAAMGDRFNKSNFDFQELLLSYVTLPGFGYRLVDDLKN